MKVLKIVIIILLVILGVVLIPPIFMPSELYLEDSRVLAAEPDAIWDQVNCLENWEKWDTWHQDSTMSGHYEGPECGVGAKNVWTYNNSDEGGSQTIVESRENEYIKTLLDFQEMGTAESEFFFEKADGGTKVTWNMRSAGSYPITRWINTLFIKPEVKKSYAKGLENLDELTNNMKPEPKYTTGKVSIEQVESMNGIAIHVVTGMEDLGKAMGTAFGKLMTYIGKNKMQMVGPPRAIWYSWEDETFEFDNVIPVAKSIKGEGDIKGIKTYAGRAMHVTHKGDYESTQYSWAVLENYMKEKNLETNGDPYEIYITDPQTEPDPTKWITELYWPVK